VSDYRRLVHEESGRVLVAEARWCHTFGGKLRGFTWCRRLPADAGLVLAEKKDSRAGTAIHMLFVFFDLGIIWVNSGSEIVDLKVARPWRPAYIPRAPARYVIETHPAALKDLSIGDHIRFEALR
jgi:uncharacterized membrane protein (UPF0127 family)